jgi:heme/copper-type cytochrome/quinol oxidase subunit 2
MFACLAAAWLVASSAERSRAVGFWVFLLSKVLWVAWGVYGWVGFSCAAARSRGHEHPRLEEKRH